VREKTRQGVCSVKNGPNSVSYSSPIVFRELRKKQPQRFLVLVGVEGIEPSTSVLPACQSRAEILD